jgi:hypothetical protein
MSRKANPKVIGGFVLGAAAVLVAAVLLLSDGGFWKDRPEYILYFEGSATGLQVGSPVVFRGVKIGSVQSIGLSVDEATLNFLVPVVIRTDEFVMKNPNGKSVELGKLAENSELLQRGLRARLKTWSFLTGQLYIDLDFYPDRPLKLYSAGKGLGDRFLKHIERTRLLLHLVDCGGLPMQPPAEAWRVVRQELDQHSADLAERPTLLVATKVEDEAGRLRAQELATASGQQVLPISSATGSGLRELVMAVWTMLSQLPRQRVD